MVPRRHSAARNIITCTTLTWITGRVLSYTFLKIIFFAKICYSAIIISMCAISNTPHGEPLTWIGEQEGVEIFLFVRLKIAIIQMIVTAHYLIPN